MQDTSVQHTDRYDLQALYETSRILSTSLDLDFVLNNLLLTALSKLMTSRGAVLLHDPVRQGYEVAVRKGRLALREGEVLQLERAPGGEIFVGDDLPEPLKKHDLCLAIPIVFGSRKIGWLLLGAKATGEVYSADEMDFMRSLVNISSSAVHNALLVKELQQANRDLDARIHELNTLFELSQEFNATLDRQRLAKLISFALMGQMMVRKHLFLLRPEESDHEFEVAAAKGIDPVSLTREMHANLCAVRRPRRLDDGEDLDDTERVLQKLGFQLALPIRKQGTTCGLLCLGPKANGQEYTPGDVEFLIALGNLAYVSVQNTHLVEEQVEKRRMEEEIQLARLIQDRLLPGEIPHAAGVDVAGIAHPSRQVGGDYFDVVQLSRGRLLVAIADVTGKGVPASLLMANVQACTHALLPIDLTIEAATSRINEVVCGNTSSANFVTFCHGIYNPEERTFQYVNAGHNPPLLIRKDGSVRLLETGGLLMGVVPSASYDSETLSLRSGDLLVFYTDGVTEAMNAAGELYEEERLRDCVRQKMSLSAEEVVSAIHADVLQFAGEPAELSDDLTLVIMKVE